MSRHGVSLPGAIAVAVLACVTAAQAQTTIEVVHAWPGHARFHEPLAEAFMQEHPDITVEFRVSPPNYQEAHLRITREALTNTLPDVYYAGYSVLRPLVETLGPRGQAIALDDVIAAEGEDWLSANYTAEVLALGQVDGRQYGIPFNASTPVVYFNADLVRQAGGDPDAFPDTWDGIIDLAQRIDALDADIDGLDFSVGSIPGDWFWQAVILERGGAMVTADESAAGYDNALGLDALTFLRRIVAETGMAVSTTPDPYRQQFFAGRLGIMVASPSGVRSFSEAVGDRFEMRTAVYPVTDRADGGLPTGGNAATVLAQDPDQQRAAWAFVKFMTGPRAQADIAMVTGYMPTNRLAADALAGFYAENPNYRSVMVQMDRARPWYGYPGPNGVEIWRAQREIIDQVQRGTLSPDQGLADLVAATNGLLDR